MQEASYENRMCRVCLDNKFYCIIEDKIRENIHVCNVTSNAYVQNHCSKAL